MKYNQIAINVSRNFLSTAIIWSNEEQWFCCIDCGCVQVVPLPPKYLHNLQRHYLGCIYWDAWQLIRRSTRGTLK